MSAKTEFHARTARVDEAAVQPLPNSRKAYVTGSRPDIRVPVREIRQTDTHGAAGVERNPSILVYDTSGPYTDPDARIDIRAGLPQLRQRWIEERGDTQQLAGPTSEYGRRRLEDPRLAELRFSLARPPRRARRSRRCTTRARGW
jgi:phosphomethylpyrimidine synthase